MKRALSNNLRIWGAGCVLWGGVLATPTKAGSIDFSSGAASPYVLLFEGGGGNTLQITNVTVNNGDIGVGNTGQTTVSGPSGLSGGINFSAPNTGQFSSNNASNVIAGGVSFNVPGVTSALN